MEVVRTLNTGHSSCSGGPSRAVEGEKEKNEKLNALGPLTLTIPLTDCLKSIPVTAYVKAVCDSRDSVDTNVPPAESFVQLLEEDCPTLMNLDSGTVEVSEPSDCELGRRFVFAGLIERHVTRRVGAGHGRCRGVCL